MKGLLQEAGENAQTLHDERSRCLRNRGGGQHGYVQVFRSGAIEAVDAKNADPMHVGAELQVNARVNLGGFTPDDVEVQLFHGLVDSFGEIPSPRTAAMSQNGAHDGATWTFHGTIPCRTSGQHGYAVRVLPRHPDLPHPFEPGLVCWG